MEDLKFISSKTRSKLFSLKREGRFSGFFSVTTFFTSVFNNNLTAIKTSGSSSITSMDVFFKLIFPVHLFVKVGIFVLSNALMLQLKHLAYHNAKILVFNY